MLKDKYFFDFKQKPGLKLKKDKLNIEVKPLVSIITSFYNGHEFMNQTFNSVINQTFPYWEWIIVDDGSTNVDSLAYLEKIKKMDKRIRVYHQENGGLAKGRDTAIKYSTTNYILPLDSDDLIEETFIETLFWTLETNKDATWAFTDSTGFGKYIYLSDCVFDSEKMKNENHITATALIRKEKILELNGYSVAKRYMNEDWYLWLRFLQKGYRPAHVRFYGFWYRRRENSLLSEINDEKKKENELRLKDIAEVAKGIKTKVEEIRFDNDDSDIVYKKVSIEDIKIINSKETVVFIIPNTGCDENLLKLIKKIYLKNEVIVVAEGNNRMQPQYSFRQKIEKYAIVYNLSSFLKKENYLNFINYIIKEERVKNIYTTEKYSELITNIIKSNNKNIKIINYKESKIFYYCSIIKYKISKFIFIRGIRHIIRKIRRKNA